MAAGARQTQPKQHLGQRASYRPSDAEPALRRHRPLLRGVGGVFQSTNRGGSWSAIDGLSDHTVFDVALDPTVPSTLYAGTDAGVFSIQLVATCAGDCNRTGDVTIDELVTLVNIALGTTQPTACTNGDPNSADIDVALIIHAVNNALAGCAG